MEEISSLHQVSVFESGVVVLWQFPLSILILGVATVLLILLPTSKAWLSLSLQEFDVTAFPRFGFSS